MKHYTDSQLIIAIDYTKKWLDEKYEKKQKLLEELKETEKHISRLDMTLNSLEYRLMNNCRNSYFSA